MEGDRWTKRKALRLFVCSGRQMSKIWGRIQLHPHRMPCLNAAPDVLVRDWQKFFPQKIPAVICSSYIPTRRYSKRETGNINVVRISFVIFYTYIGIQLNKSVRILRLKTSKKATEPKRKLMLAKSTESACQKLELIAPVFLSYHVNSKVDT